jgi:RNA polymerase sigma-70 factor (ECF subfamily)
MAHLEDLDDAELARRAAAGSVESFAELARRYQTRIVHYVRQVLGASGNGDADDVAQEAFVRAWQSIGRFDTRWAFSTWLFTIARRTCLNHLRGARRRRVRETVSVPDCDGTEDPCVTALAVERAVKLWDVAADRLSERQFTVLWLRYAESKPLPEIAAVVETTEANVKVMLFRARQRLAPFVQDLVE